MSQMAIVHVVEFVSGSSRKPYGALGEVLVPDQALQTAVVS